MKHLPRLLGIAILIGLTGCMDLQIKMTLKDDWTTTAYMRVEMLDQMFELLKMQIQQSGESADFLNEASLREKIEGDGGKLVKYVNEVDEGIRSLEIEMWFPNAQTLVEKAGQGQFTLKQDNDEWILSMMDTDIAASFKDLDQQQLIQQMEGMTPMLAGLKLDINLIVPELVSTNLPKSDKTSATYSLNYDGDISGKSGEEAINAFRGFLSPKWVRFKGVPPVKR